jgi:ribosome recycling factor
MSEEQIIKDLRRRMDGALEVLRKEFAGLRTGRASASLLDPVAVETIRVPIPDLNEERRKELAKVAAKYAEQARISVRNVRRDGMDLLKKQEKDHKLTQDQHRKLDKDIQTLTDDTIKKVDGLLAQKDKEILQV